MQRHLIYELAVNKHAQSPIYKERFKACYIVGIMQFNFYHWDSYVIPSKQSIIQTAQHDWPCAEMARSELSYFCRCCSTHYTTCRKYLGKRHRLHYRTAGTPAISATELRSFSLLFGKKGKRVY